MPAETPPAAIPLHIEQTAAAIARLHADHHKRATPLQRIVERLTAMVARPAFIGVVTAGVILWIAGNLLLRWLAGWSFDAPTFPWLQGAGELATIYITTLVLISQKRKDELSDLREQLTLELAAMTEQKGAKIIALLEEMRRDNPMIADRVDQVADAMATPADPKVVLEIFKETHDDMLAEVQGTGAGP